MNVRRASSTARRSGVMTRRTDTRSASRSTSPIASTPRTTPVTSAIASSSGSATSSTARENGRAALSAPRSCAGTTRSSHQRATSGSESSRRVSPVGAQSTTTTSNSSLSAWRRSRSRASSSSRPGGTVISSAVIRSAPRRRSCAESQSRTEAQLRSISACAWTCSAHSRSPACVGLLPISMSSTSASECAGSVEKTRVRAPDAAARRAVAAATEVLPTPPFPVCSTMRGPMAKVERNSEDAG